MEALLSMKQENIFLIDDYNKTSSTGETIGDFLIDDETDYCFSKPTMIKPMEGLNEASPTPFLKKTYEMVEDHETDEIISWSGTKKSFVVWDYHHFSTSLLPKHFKHNNFSSFIRQLNTYGFKKIDPHRWEFANEGFQEGQKHLLKNIKRRKQITQNSPGTESEIEKLNNDRIKLETEISNLKQQQETTNDCLAAMKERMESNESRQQRMFCFMAKAFSNPGFLRKFIQVLRSDRGFCGTQDRKRRRLVAPESDKDKNKHEEFPMEMDTLFSPSDEDGSSGSEGQKGKFTSTSPEDELDFGQNQNDFELELENLITKPTQQWANYIRDMVMQDADAI